MLKRIHELKAEKGFTLIELLIVVAIIGILAAIAIPQFAQYRIRSFNSSGLSDLRNARTSQEALFADWQAYGMSVAAALPGGGGSGLGALLTGPTGAANPTTLTLFDRTCAAGGRGITTPVGNLVDLVSSTDAAACPAVPGSYIMASKHPQGDTGYAADSDSTANYRDPVTFPPAIRIANTEPAPASTPAVDDVGAIARWAAM